jgi:hypothetical protein
MVTVARFAADRIDTDFGVVMVGKSGCQWVTSAADFQR